MAFRCQHHTLTVPASEGMPLVLERPLRCPIGFEQPVVVDELVSITDVIVVQEGRILVADVVVDVVEYRSVPAWYRVLGSRARQCQLVEHGQVSAQEAVPLQLSRLGGSSADVVNPAVVVHVREVTVMATDEPRRQGFEKQLGTVGQRVCLALHPELLSNVEGRDK